MSFQILALISLIALVGPLLALPKRLQAPVVLGELAVGVVFGATGTQTLHAQDKTFTFLANLGFALVMFVAGSRVPVRDPRLKAALGPGLRRALAVAVLAVVAAAVLARLFHTGHTALYAVLMASSSAALVLPIVDSLNLGGTPVLELLPQVALADTLCIVAVPLAIDPAHAGRAAIGSAAVLSTAGLAFLILRHLEVTGIRRRVHRVSEDHKFALELRVSLMILCGLAALATKTHVSIMLAGFSLGLAIAAIGAPRRLARQLFAVTEGFLGPLFFVWVGASLDLRALAHHRSYVLLGAALGAGALICHWAMKVSGQPVALGALASAQLGVPVAAVTVGSQLHVLKPGESAGLILGALITIAVASVAAGRLSGADPAATTGTSARSTTTDPPGIPE